jgi:hypothetical protein
MTATASVRGTSHTSASDDGIVVRGIRNGLIASLAMAMVMMVLGLFDRGFFAAPSSIWAFWAGPAAYAPTTFSLSFVLGAMGHMMNSAILGIVFAFIASRALHLSGTLASVMAGVVFALIVMAVMWLLVLPLGANGNIVKDSAATWIWALGHAAYGMVGGALYARWR